MKKGANYSAWQPQEDPLDAARGCIFGFVIGLVAWIIILGALLWWVK